MKDCGGCLDRGVNVRGRDGRDLYQRKELWNRLQDNHTLMDIVFTRVNSP